MKYNVLDYLEDSATNFPERIALSDDKNSITYLEYVSKAKTIGSYLANRFECRCRPVAILIERNIESIIAFMGVVYSGNFYVPIDCTMPDERIQHIYNTLLPIATIDARVSDTNNSDTLDYQYILDNSCIDDKKLDDIKSYIVDTDPLYSIFTSGSTGEPKGVLVTHRGVIDMVEAFGKSFGFDNSQVFGNQAPFDFDVSVKDIYNAMRIGASVAVIPKKLFKTPKLLIEYIKTKNINTLIWAVSALRIISDFKALEDETLSIKYVMFSGEVMPPKSINYWIDHVTDAMYVNLYGPTEITCNCAYYIMDGKYDEMSMIPIGKSFPNTRVNLFDENKKIIDTKGTVGEIGVIGSGVSLGYWNNAEQTQKAFINNPNVSEYFERVYMTGDIAVYNEDMDLVFVARKDNQIKHMGHRIELGEVEMALNSIGFVKNAICFYDAVKEKIVCCYEADRECKKDIVVTLTKKIPKYMWPNIYRYYESLPMNKNSKVDRVKLKKDYGIN